MNAITSICIPRIECVFTAEFIADSFDRNGIAQVSKVYIEPYKYINKNEYDNNYNRAYIAIKSWHDTEAAFNFIECLRNPKKEARIVYSCDFWWPVIINNNINKLASNKRVLTIFEEKQLDFLSDDLSTTALVSDELEEFIQIDAEKTKLLRNIVANFKVSKPTLEDYETPYRIRAMHNREYLLQDMDESVDSFDGYLREMHDDRDKWFSEQYIYDALCM